MRILFIHQYFRTPEEGGGIRSYYMCKALLREGHQVEVITAHNQKKALFKLIEGIKVHYLPVFYENKLGFTGRSFAFFKFLLLATVKALKIPKAELAYGSSSPLTVGIITIILKKLRGTPYIFEVMDLWPEAPIQMGFIKNRALKVFLRWMESSIYSQAKVIVAASPGMKEGIKMTAPRKHTIIIPNISDCDFFKPSPKNPLFLEKYNVTNKLVCCYTGAIGLSNDLKNLIEVAYFLKEKKVDYVQFLIAGEGSETERIQAMAEKKALRNVTFIGYLSKKEVVEVYNVSDLNLIFFNSQPILETNSPNKFFDGLAAGLPAIININGWIKDLCEEHQCGQYFNRNEPDQFLQVVNEFYRDKELLKKYSVNARMLAESRFSKQIVLSKFLELFQ